MEKEEDNKTMFFLGLAVAISTLILNVVQIRSFAKSQEKENKPDNNNQF